MKRSLFILLIPLIFTGCKDTGGDDTGHSNTIFSITPASVPLDNTEQTASVTLDAKYPSGNTAFSAVWTLSSDQTWLRFSLNSEDGGATATINGTGRKTVYLVVEENTGESSRTAEIFVNGESTAIAAVIQSGAGGNNDDGPITVAVTPAVIPAMSGDTQAPSLKYLTVACTNDKGKINSQEKWTLTSGGAWLTLTLNEDGTGAAASVNGTGPQTVYLVAAENSGSGPRTADITLAGVTTPVSSVTQAVKTSLSALPSPAANALDDITGLFGELPTAGTSYVGAFWRAGQIGERVIVTQAGENAGGWSAVVAWYDSKWNPAGGDGVVLAAGDSADTNIRTSSPGDAESYKVGGTAATVTGTVAADGDIVFRIGLTKEFTAYNKESNPARYAVVKLSYAGNTKHQLIFLRQGEGADYVMRAGDKDDSGGSVGDSDNRSFARKFTVYNLTASDAEWAAKPGGVSIDIFPQLEVRGGTFVQYPTQGGGIFQGMGKTAKSKRRVYDRANLIGGKPIDWEGYSSATDENFWNASTDETCPAGYRRGRDGDITVFNVDQAVVKGSEARQSLWLSPTEGVNVISDLQNSAWGYYADGYFDRRQNVDGVVGGTGLKVAQRGRVFFNPATYASLFFPASGYVTNEGFLYSGERAYYWWSTAFSGVYMGCMFVTHGHASPYRQNRGTYAWSIRCIQEP